MIFFTREKACCAQHEINLIFAIIFALSSYVSNCSIYKKLHGSLLLLISKMWKWLGYVCIKRMASCDDIINQLETLETLTDRIRPGVVLISFSFNCFIIIIVERLFRLLKSTLWISLIFYLKLVIEFIFRSRVKKLQREANAFLTIFMHRMRCFVLCFFPEKSSKNNLLWKIVSTLTPSGVILNKLMWKKLNFFPFQKDLYENIQLTKSTLNI